MFKLSVRGFTSIAFISVVGASLSSMACSSAAPKESDSSASDNAPSTATLPVTKDAQGWLHYTNTAISKIDLVNPTTKTIAGTRDTDGNCEVSSYGVVAEGSGPWFEEDVAFNTVTCERVTISGGITEASLALLDEMAVASATPTRVDELVTTELASRAATKTHSAATPAVTYTHSAYVKTAWIDPLNITITSLSNNLDWDAALDLHALEVAYKFKYDGWSMNPGAPSITWSSGPGWAAATGHEQFRNTDFERIIVALFGVSGYAACGFNGSAAVFTHNVVNYGHSNGTDAVAWNDTAQGGCVNLVHHREWNGPGHSN